VLFFKYNNGHFSNQTRILAKNAVKFKEIMETPKDKVLEYHNSGAKIKKVECSEGGVYELGDKIQIFGGSKNPVFRNKKYYGISVIGNGNTYRLTTKRHDENKSVAAKKSINNNKYMQFLLLKIPEYKQQYPDKKQTEIVSMISEEYKRLFK
jgi:hypothetical protein